MGKKKKIPDVGRSKNLPKKCAVAAIYCSCTLFTLEFRYLVPPTLLDNDALFFFFKWQLQSVTLIIRSNFYSSSISIHTNMKGNLTSYHKSSKCLDYFFRLKLHSMIQAICTLNINAWVKKLSIKFSHQKFKSLGILILYCAWYDK